MFASAEPVVALGDREINSMDLIVLARVAHRATLSLGERPDDSLVNPRPDPARVSDLRNLVFYLRERARNRP